MRKVVFRVLARINKHFLPRISRRDLNRLTRAEKLIVAWRYWVTRNALD
jgi:uncharacterized protein (UPF0216 family)